MYIAINSMRMKVIVLILRIRHFTYSNRSITYVYSWKGDNGSQGHVSMIFINNSQTSACEDSTVDFIKKTKMFLQMELYYCGLSLEKLQAE